MSFRRSNVERSAATRTHVIACARSLFAAQGWADTSMAQVAHSAQVSTGALYHHWTTKAQLMDAVVSELHREISAEVHRSTRDETSPRRRLDTAAAVFLRRCEARDVGQILLIDGPAVLAARWDEMDRRWWLAPTEELLSRAVAAGELATADPRLLATALVGSLTALGRCVTNHEGPGHEAAVGIFRSITGALFNAGPG